MGSRIKLILKIIIIVLVAVAVIGTGAYFGVKYFKGKDKNNEENETPSTNPVFSTNSYNEAITKNKLTTVNYSGSYEFKRVNKVVFNKKSEENPNGLDEDAINRLYGNYIENGDYTQFCKYLDDKKKAEVNENIEYITIVTPTDPVNGKISSYGLYTMHSKDTNTKGVLYGDENLAVAVMTNTNVENDHMFMSLHYSDMDNAISVSQKKESDENIIYVFKNVYSKNDTSLLLFTITYEYKLIVEDTSIPSKDLVFDL